MAGAGFKTFASGEVLTAANVNTYLMQQTVMVFADSSARSTALGANVSEGMLSYLKDTNKVEVYDGSSWVASDDPNAIQNTIVDAKGDLISATAADTPAILAVGTNGQYLQADSTTSTGLKWATVSAGWTLIATATPSAASTVSFTSIPTTYTQLMILWDRVQISTETRWNGRINNDSGANYTYTSQGYGGASSNVGDTKIGYNDNTSLIVGATNTTNVRKGSGKILIERASSTDRKLFSYHSTNFNTSLGANGPMAANGHYDGSAAVTQFEFIREDGTCTITGNFYLLGI